jgi:hypothetical protein
VASRFVGDEEEWDAENEEQTQKAYAQTGKLRRENDRLKKTFLRLLSGPKARIDQENSSLSLSHQCLPFNVHCNGLYGQSCRE